jgi:hypothetical protein
MKLFKWGKSEDKESADELREQRRRKREQEDAARRLRLIQYEVDVIQRRVGK